MKFFLNSLCLFILAALISSPVLANGRDQLTAFSKGLNGLDGRFEQRVYDANGRQTQVLIGTVKLAAPNQFRWETNAPSPQLIVADGARVWLFDPDLDQVTVRSQGSAEQDSPLAVLVNPALLDKQFNSRDGGKSVGLDWLVLTPKSLDDAPFQQARLGFGPAGLARMEFEDTLGQRTLLIFSSWSRNPKFPAGTFRFVPAKGVEVVGDAGNR